MHPLSPALALAIAAFAAPALATVLVVKDDGTGDYPTIQAAVDAAVDGDEVHLAPGMYGDEGHLPLGSYGGDDNRNIRFNGKAITVRSQSLDPSTVTIVPYIDAFTTCRAFLFESAETNASVLEGVTIAYGWADDYDGPSGIVLCRQSSPTIRNCVFRQNQGSCILVVDGGPLIEDCVFQQNTSMYNSGLGVSGGGHGLVIRNCQFFDNHGKDSAGGASVAVGLITGCTFSENGMGYIGGSLSLGSAAVAEDCLISGFATISGGGVVATGGAVLRRCAIVGRSDRGSAMSMYSTETAPPVTVENCYLSGSFAHNGDVIEVNSGTLRISNSIIAFSSGAAPCDFGCGPIDVAPGALVEIECTDIFGNQAGDWVGAIANMLGQDGNIGADPLLCPGVDGIYSNSPCAPLNSGGCGLIGLYGVACDPSSVETKSWGVIKGMYR